MEASMAAGEMFTAFEINQQSLTLTCADMNGRDLSHGALVIPWRVKNVKEPSVSGWHVLLCGWEKAPNPGVRVSTLETLAMISFSGLVEGLVGELADVGTRTGGCGQRAGGCGSVIHWDLMKFVWFYFPFISLNNNGSKTKCGDVHILNLACNYVLHFFLNRNRDSHSCFSSQDYYILFIYIKSEDVHMITTDKTFRLTHDELIISMKGKFLHFMQKKV